MSPCWLSQFMTHVPAAAAALAADAFPVAAAGSVPVTVRRLSESAQIGPVLTAAAASTRPFTQYLSRPPASAHRVVLLVPSAISVMAVLPFCRIAPLLPSPAHGMVTRVLLN